MAPPLAKVKKEKKSRPAVFRRHQHDIKHRVGVRAAAPPRPTTPLCPTRARGPAALPRPPCPLPSRRRRHPEIIMSAPSLARGGSIGAPPGGARVGGGGLGRLGAPHPGPRASARGARARPRGGRAPGGSIALEQAARQGRERGAGLDPPRDGGGGGGGGARVGGIIGGVFIGWGRGAERGEEGWCCGGD